MARVLFLHGLDAKPGGIKPTYLSEQGHEVINPSLPRDDFPLSVEIAQKELEVSRPDVVVGSSRGGAVALAMDIQDVPVIVLAPAWRFFDVPVRIPPVLRILHAPADSLIPIAHSHELLDQAGNSDIKLIEVGEAHSMTDLASLTLLNDLIRELAKSR
jgi:hypothetical protein